VPYPDLSGAGRLEYTDFVQYNNAHLSSFDLMTFRDLNLTTVEDDFGNKKELNCNESYYILPERLWLLKSLGFKSTDIHGAKLGAFSRNDKLTAEDYEMLVIAEK
jgi:hypothetical protein